MNISGFKPAFLIFFLFEWKPMDFFFSRASLQEYSCVTLKCMSKTFAETPNVQMQNQFLKYFAKTLYLALINNLMNMTSWDFELETNQIMLGLKYLHTFWNPRKSETLLAFLLKSTKMSSRVLRTLHQLKAKPSGFKVTLTFSSTRKVK